MHLTALFDRSLVGRADRVGLEVEDATQGPGRVTSFTFGELDARANRMAHELVARGLTAGDRVCLHLGNSVAFVDLFLACTRLGVILVPMNVLYKDRELRHIIGDAEPKAVVTEPGADTAYPAGANRWMVDDLAAAATARSATRLVAPHDGDAPAVIVYTSGTTGVAKGAVLSHKNLVANGVSLTTCWRITADDRYLAVLPLFHVHGLGNGLCSWLASGCRMRLAPRFEQRTAAALFRGFQPTLFFGVPTIYHRLVDPAVVSDEDATAIGATARLFVSGSAPLTAHVFDAFRRRFRHTILERYGMSEALMITSNPYDGERRPGSVGLPLPDVSVRLADEAGAVVPDGEVGEVQIRSPALFRGYWRNAAASAAASTTDGWFRTGDLGVRSADGYYSLRGRRGDLIISGGFNIYPREIEDLLLEDRRVHDVAVVGAPDAARGEIPVAYVVADAALDVAELAERCRTHLASFKTPRAFVRVDSLPRTALGKVQKHLLPSWTA